MNQSDARAIHLCIQAGTGLGVGVMAGLQLNQLLGSVTLAMVGAAITFALVFCALVYVLREV